MMQDQLTVTRIMEHAVFAYPEGEIVWPGPTRIERMSYRDLAARTERLAGWLTSLSLPTGARVATLAMNHGPHLETYFAAACGGHVCHTINPRLSVSAIRYIIDDADDQLIFFDPAFEVLLANALKGRPRRPQLVRYPGGLGSTVGRDDQTNIVNDYEVVVNTASAIGSWPELDERRACGLCYTSGTTGSPKGVLYDHRASVLQAMAITMTNNLAVSGAHVLLPLVPMFHVQAWAIPHAAPMTGAKLVLPGAALDGQSVFELIEAENVTLAAGVPTIWETLLLHVEANDLRFSTLQVAAVGGAAASESLIKRLEAHGLEVFHGWGMTELAPNGSTSRSHPLDGALDTAGRQALKARQGRPMFGLRMRTIGDDATEILPGYGRAGHLEVRGPWVASGYFNAASADSHTADGWFRTGDIAEIDACGRMQITDRAKDVIKSGGEWISSIAIEAAALALPGIAQAAAIGMPHPKWDERPVLFLVAHHSHRDADAIRHALASTLARWQIPDEIFFVETLPIGPTGKILKSVLRESLAKASQSRPEAAA